MECCCLNACVAVAVVVAAAAAAAIIAPCRGVDLICFDQLSYGNPRCYKIKEEEGKAEKRSEKEEKVRD